MADPDAEKDGSLASSSAVDERKIETAVKFLQNPKVQATPMSRRIGFLQQKGLSKAEIDAAIAQSGSVEYTPEAGTDNFSRSLPVTASRSYQGELDGSRPGWSNIIVTAILGGGVAYVINSLVKRYIAPLLLGKDKNDEILEQLLRTVKLFEERHTELNTTLQNSFQNIEGLLERQQITLNGMKMQGNPIADVVSMSELKSELTSMKSLLLARNQFPPSPFSQSGSAPAIPAWQKAAAMKKQAAQQEKQDTLPTPELINGDQCETNADTQEKDNDVENDSVITGSNDDNEPSPSLSSTFVKVES